MAFLSEGIIGRFLEIAFTTMLIILVSVIVGLILAFPVMWLWNFIFGEYLKINMFQAWSLNVLCGILFGRGTGSKK